MSRTLYLVVKQSESDGEWKFPNFKQERMVPLHELAETGLYSIGGKINYFNVSRVPCHVIQDSKIPQTILYKISHIIWGI